MTAAVKAFSGFLVLVALVWVIATAPGDSGASERPSLLTRMSGPECIADRGGRQCEPGITAENDELTFSPDGKNGYIVSSYYDNAERSHGEIWIYDRNPATGSLVQKQGMAGCIAQGRTKGCARGRALIFGSKIVIAPDGRNVYASTGDSIAVFDRDPATGELTQPAGATGCVTSRRGENLSCSRARGLGGEGLAVSPDGLNVYAAGHPITVFDRDPATGALTETQGTESDKLIAGDVVVSPDGENVYVSVYEPDRLISFDRGPITGALTRVPGPTGCISEKGKGGCRRGHEFDNVFDLAISPDGRDLYGATSHGLGQGDYGTVMILDRLPDGTVVQKRGKAGCIAMFGGEYDACKRTESISEADDIAVSRDGERVNVFSYFGDVPTVLFRHPSGRLTERP